MSDKERTKKRQYSPTLRHESGDEPKTKQHQRTDQKDLQHEFEQQQQTVDDANPVVREFFGFAPHKQKHQKATTQRTKNQNFYDHNRCHVVLEMIKLQMH